MTASMKRWLHEHGLTAVRVAEAAGMLVPDLYRQLSGRMPVQPELPKTLRGIFGMTVEEYEQAMPKKA